MSNINTAPIRRRIVEGARLLAQKRDVSMDDVRAAAQPLAELVAAETGIDVEIIIRVKQGRR